MVGHLIHSVYTQAFKDKHDLLDMLRQSVRVVDLLHSMVCSTSPRDFDLLLLKLN